MRCGVCSHGRREELEEAAGREDANLLALAEQYAVSATALERHLASHPRAPKTKKAKVRAPSDRATRPKARAPRPAPVVDVVAPAPGEEAPATSRSPTSMSTARGKLDDLLGSLKKLADSIGPDATVSERIAVFRASVAPIKLLGQLTGELGASDATVAASPHYRRIRTAIIEALKEHPAALQAVERALSELAPGRAEKAA